MLMTETYTQTISPREATEEADTDMVRLDVDDQLFYDMLKVELDVLLRQPRSGVINEIRSYSRTRRAPLM